MTFPCPNLSKSVVFCNEVLHYCDVNFATLKEWCHCIEQNLQVQCRDATYASLFVTLFSLFMICLFTFLCCALCRGLEQKRVDLPPPPYIPRETLSQKSEAEI